MKWIQMVCVVLWLSLGLVPYAVADENSASKKLSKALNDYAFSLDNLNKVIKDHVWYKDERKKAYDDYTAIQGNLTEDEKSTYGAMFGALDAQINAQKAALELGETFRKRAIDRYNAAQMFFDDGFYDASEIASGNSLINTNAMQVFGADGSGRVSDTLWNELLLIQLQLFINSNSCELPPE